MENKGLLSIFALKNTEKGSLDKRFPKSAHSTPLKNVLL